MLEITGPPKYVRCAPAGADVFFMPLDPLSKGTIWTNRCSAPASTTGAAWVCADSPDKVCPVATDEFGCESATGLFWAEALPKNPKSKTTTEQTNARVRGPKSAAIERRDTGVGGKGLNTNTPYNFAATGHNSRGQVMKFTKQSSCSSIKKQMVLELNVKPR